MSSARKLAASEVADLVMPVLQSIQARLGRIESDVADVKLVQGAHSQKLEDIEIHLGYLTGIESQNKFDLSKLRERIRAMEERFGTLEPRS